MPWPWWKEAEFEWFNWVIVLSLSKGQSEKSVMLNSLRRPVLFYRVRS